MEETDLAWRLADLGKEIWYDAGARVFHPASTPERHPESVRRTAMNRAWIAHRNLPAPLVVTYLTAWWAITSIRTRQPRFVASSMWSGWRGAPGRRQPIGWHTVLALSKRGRPPTI
jgi:GT2 family glycosyltransferase